MVTIKEYNIPLIGYILLIANLMYLIAAHDAKDFDDTILYKIDFDVPDFDKHPVSKRQTLIFHIIRYIFSLFV